MSGGYRHRPVMLDEVVEALRPVPAGVVVDATVGGGGHARGLLEARPDLSLIGLDRDDEAIAASTEALRGFAGRAILRRAPFDEIDTIVQELGHEGAVGVLFDLGVSSPQVDDPGRGFSYRADGPLDMRMDRRQARTAADLVNSASEDDLAHILGVHGGERFNRRIARAVVAARPLRRTGELVDVIRSAIPAPARRRGGHPAKRTFQAIRIELNGELEMLPRALDRSIDVLVPGGRTAVLAYHSGEDRIVKERFREAATGGCTCPPGLPCQCGAAPVVRLVRRGVRKPSAAEVDVNPRADSARLRVVEKLPSVHLDDEPDGDDAA